jgi:sigma-E factor negative regulatory protein RseB
MRISFLVLILSTCCGPVWAQESTEAQALLQKMQTASRNVDYVGTFVFQHDNEIFSSRIVHRFNAGDEQEKIEKLDGRRREFIRHNEDIIGYQPDTKTLRDEKRQAQDMFPAVLAFNVPNLGEHYSFKLTEITRVAGVECRMVIIEPKDALRYGYRLCAATLNNLMLLAQTTGPGNQTLEQIAFTSLTFGNVDENSVKTSFVDTTGWKTVHGAVAVAIESGWTVKKVPPGFKKIREVRRLISTNLEGQTDRKASDLHEVLQLVFSDGLATISVFIEPMIAQRQSGIVQKGATTISGFQVGNYWATVVGEVPAAAIKLLSDSIEYKPK